jgi:hypothetical protein
MYNPNIDYSESETSSEAGDDIEYNPDEETIDHVDALEHWTKFRKHLVLKEMFPPIGEPIPETHIADEGALGLQNTKLTFEIRRQTHVIMVNSLDRDQHSYPLPTQVRLKLPRIYKNIERIDIVQIKFFCGIYAITAARNNNRLWFSDASGTYSATISNGTYSIGDLLNNVAAAMTAASGRVYTAVFNTNTGRVQITGPDPFSLLFYSKAYPMYNQTAYTEWGLGWVLGWGGLPVDLSGASSYTADHFPRIIDDYIYLLLNDTERLNDVDHTDLEDVPTAQESTGQVSHYFGKLLLNSFGSYAQTFIEAPKLFAPVLGRLDRLNFTWTDRHGNPLLGPDAASCDWHMALRITEIVEGPAAASTLVMNQPTQN